MAERGHVVVDRAIHLIRNLKGVVEVRLLESGHKQEIQMIESSHGNVDMMPVINKGVEACMSRAFTLCILKDTNFRPPPSPTVQLVDGDGEILGHEILPGSKIPKDGRKQVVLGKSFVVFHKPGKGRDAHFLLPPVRFPELERLRGVADVVSGSLSASADQRLRRLLSQPEDARFATILVGFNVSETDEI